MRKVRPSAPAAPSRLRIALAERLEPRALLSAGDFDPTFGIGGRVTLDLPASADDQGAAVVVQPDGRYVVAGSIVAGYYVPDSAFGLARYHPDGRLDSTFGDGGRVIVSFGRRSEASAIALAPDGKIVVAGITSFALGRDGTHTPRFDIFAVARLNPDGSLDSTFDRDGKQTIDFGAGAQTLRGVAIQPDGKVVLAGFSGALGSEAGDAALARLNGDGSLDATFDGDGRVWGTIAGQHLLPSAVAIDAERNIVGVANVRTHADGHNYDDDLGVFRLRPDGAPDPSFDGDGVADISFGSGSSYPNDLALAPDGKIVATGTRWPTDFAVARFNADGTPDTSFGGGDGTAIVGPGAGGAVALAPDGKIIVGGQYGRDWTVGGSQVLARLDATGVPDPTFDGDGTLTGRGIPATVSDLAVTSDGSIIAVGAFKPAGGTFDFLVSRFSESGAPDISFDGDGHVTTDFMAVAPSASRAVAVQPDGKTIVAGSSSSNAVSPLGFLLARFNADGSPDTAFGQGGLVAPAFDDTRGFVADMALQTDGRIVVLSATYDPSNTRRDVFAVARFRPDGSPDVTFGESGWATFRLGSFTRHGRMAALAIQADGKIIVAGDDNTVFATARLDADGSLDPTFGGDGIVTTRMEAPGAGEDGRGFITDVALGADGTIIVAGPTFGGNVPSTTFGVARYDASGNLDPTFAGGGKMEYQVDGVGHAGQPVRIALTPNGSLVVGTTVRQPTEHSLWPPHDFLLTRLLPSGEIDRSFGPAPSEGILRLDFAGGDDVLHTLLLEGDSIVAVGTAATGPGDLVDADFALARFHPSGQLDMSFGTGGKVRTDFSALPDAAFAAALAPAGRLVVAGSAVTPGQSTDIAVARYLLTGDSPLPHVIGAHVFYGNSAFGDSIAPDKQPLLPGESPSFQNTTSYTRGLNGVVVDVMNPYGVELADDDFAFRSAAGSPRSAWAEGPRPASVTVQRAAGAGGSDRVKIVWDDYNPRSDSPNQAVANGWLEVTVKPAKPRLAGPFVFRFGNLVGETGNGPAADVLTFAPRVDSQDFAATVSAQRKSYGDIFDFNRDGRVNVLDVAIARLNHGRILLTPTELLPRRRRGDYLAVLGEANGF